MTTQFDPNTNAVANTSDHFLKNRIIKNINRELKAAGHENGLTEKYRQIILNTENL